MAFSSTIQILKINEVQSGVSAKTNKPWDRQTAECLLMTDDGQVDCVGKLTLPKALREQAKIGVFRASFSLVVPTFGDRQGEIQAQLVGLVPVPSRTAQPAPKAV